MFTALLVLITDLTERDKMAHILLVENNIQIQHCLQVQLGLMGHTVMVANHGLEALNILATGIVFDFVMTDNHMEVMGGVEFIKEVKKLGYGFKIIMITGSRNVESEADYILHKPFDLASLEIAIDFALVSFNNPLEMTNV